MRNSHVLSNLTCIFLLDTAQKYRLSLYITYCFIKDYKLNHVVKYWLNLAIGLSLKSTEKEASYDL